MKLVRKSTAVLAAGTLGAFALSGCAITEATQGDDDEIVVGFAVANQQSDFFNLIRQSIEEAGKDAGVEVSTADAQGDADKQVDQMQNFVTQGVDVIIYIAAGASAAAVPVRDAKEAGIPVITVDRNPEEEPGDTFIATDSVASSKALGEWVGEQTGGEGNIGVIQGQVGTTPEIDRDTGFKEGIAEFPGLKEVARQATDQWMQDEGYDIATDMLQSHPEIDVFFGRADSLALGAAGAARAAGRDDILVVGHDGDRAALEALQDGVIDATMIQQTNAMGELAIESAMKLANGEEVPPIQLQEAVLATADNVEPYIENHP